ncbi:MAG TPA: hypothetical protein VFS55_15680, partial [Dokdonella sp.]|nr:hypothetical protein [Dokdonella sp.]
MKTTAAKLALVVALGSAVEPACAAAPASTMPPASSTGPRPALPPPNTSLVPTVEIADAVGWKDGEAPTAAAGFAVAEYARDLEHPRWLGQSPSPESTLFWKLTLLPSSLERQRRQMT